MLTDEVKRFLRNVNTFEVIVIPQIHVVSFDIDLTLCYMNDAVDHADLHFFQYVTSKYPDLGISYQEESSIVI